MQSSSSLLNINTMASTYSNNNDADIDWDKLPQIENVRINYTDSKHALPGQGPYSYTYKVNIFSVQKLKCRIICIVFVHV